MAERRIALRIDVDFLSGWLDAAPFFLDALGERGMYATFFGVAGWNRPAASLRRLADPAYRRRYRRLGPWRVFRALRHDRSPSVPMLETPGVAETLRRIEAEGHELAVHGWDHSWWAEHVWTAPLARIEAEIERAYAAYAAAVGDRPRAWASPNWRTREDVVASLARRGVPYLSEGWGQAPFRCRGSLNLPVTECLEPEWLDAGREERTRLVDRRLDTRVADDYRVLCVHDYFEGLLAPRLFETLLEACAARGIVTETLRSVAVRRAGAAREASFGRRPLQGFPGEVSWQEEEASAVVSSAAP